MRFKTFKTRQPSVFCFKKNIEISKKQLKLSKSPTSTLKIMFQSIQPFPSPPNNSGHFPPYDSNLGGTALPGVAAAGIAVADAPPAKRFLGSVVLHPKGNLHPSISRNQSISLPEMNIT